MLDLFSFDVPRGSHIRTNLEALFRKYEDNVASYSSSLIEKLSAGKSDIQDELVNLFAAKLLNFVRNPFCIQKVLNSFPPIGAYEPTDPKLNATYRRIVTGRKPHQAHLCKQLGISSDTYVAWLRLLFMLLMPLGNAHQNLFEGVIEGLFENRNAHVAVFVWLYEHDYVLLSDRGFCQVLPDPRHMAMSFNVCSTVFIDYVFADAATLAKGMEDRASPQFLERALSAFRRRPNAVINLTVKKNDLSALARYNRRVIEWSRDRVYCAVKSGILLS